MRKSIEADPRVQTVESAPLAIGLHEEVLAVAIAGSFSSAQVYFIGSDLWVMPTIFVRLYGRVGGGRLLLSEVALTSTTYTQEGGVTTALTMAVRGVPVEGFEVVLAQNSDGGGEMSGGRLVLVASSGADGAQGAAAAQSGRWPVFLSDGKAEVGSATNALHTRKSDRRAAYYASGVVGTGTSSTSDKSILYVWNAATEKRCEIRRITIAYLAGDGASILTVKGAHVHEQASPIGGSGMTPLPLDPSDGEGILNGVAGANSPVRVALDLFSFAVPFATTGTFVWTWTDLGKPIVLPAAMHRGFEIRADVSASATTEMTLHVSMEWVEI